MNGFTKAKRSALVAAAGLMAALSVAAPAGAAGRQAAAPARCHIISGLDRADHTGQMWAYGYTSCRVNGPARMDVNIWVDKTPAKGKRAARPCQLRSHCYTVSGMITPRSGRHLYCSQVWFYWASLNPTQTSWTCRYIIA